MRSFEQVDASTNWTEVEVSRPSRVFEEDVIVQSAREVDEGEHVMVVDLQANAATEYEGYEALVNRAVDVFGDELIAARWLSTPSVDLNGDVPLRRARELGYEHSSVQNSFEPIFVRIEHGVYF